MIVFAIARPCLNYPPKGFTPYGPNRVERVLNRGLGTSVVARYLEKSA